jgi:hypothetical protein
MSDAKQVDSIEINGGEVHYQITIHHDAEPDEEGYINAHIPSFDIYFHVPEGGNMLERAWASVNSFLEHLVDQEDGWKRLLIQINKLGFRMHSHDSEFRKMLNGVGKRKARFKSKLESRPPVGYGRTSQMSHSKVFAHQ